MRLNASVVFTAILGITVLIFLLGAKNYGHKAWIYPTLAGIPAFVLLLVQLHRDLRGQKSEERVFDIAKDESVPEDIVKKRVTRFVCWLLGLYAVIWLIGFKVGILLFLISFLKIEAKLKGFKAVYMITLLSVIMLFLLLVQYAQVFGVRWPEGLIESYIPLSSYLSLRF